MMSQTMIEPRLYIIMREDLWDMNPGKGMAQAAHAQAVFDDFVSRYTNVVYKTNEANLNPEFLELVQDWRGKRAFGTTLVLTAPKSEWMDIQYEVEHYGYVVDPSYPWRNYYGKTYTTEEDTCMWVFAVTEKEIEHMKQWPLHP